MRNFCDAKVGKRIRLLGTMKNIDSQLIPEEDIPAGTEGTIILVNIHGNHDYDQITVRWDGGRTIGLFPYQDEYEIF